METAAGFLGLASSVIGLFTALMMYRLENSRRKLEEERKRLLESPVKSSHSETTSLPRSPSSNENRISQITRSIKLLQTIRNTFTPISHGLIVQGILLLMGFMAGGGLGLSVATTYTEFNAQQTESIIAEIMPHLVMALNFAATFILLPVAFVLSAVFSKGNRWVHLLLVALTIWIIDVFVIRLSNQSIIDSFEVFRLVGILVMMGIGGGFSYLLRRKGRYLVVASTLIRGISLERI